LSHNFEIAATLSQAAGQSTPAQARKAMAADEHRESKPIAGAVALSPGLGSMAAAVSANGVLEILLNPGLLGALYLTPF
jgi:hypothetical protein